MFRQVFPLIFFTLCSMQEVRAESQFQDEINFLKNNTKTISISPNNANSNFKPENIEEDEIIYDEVSLGQAAPKRNTNSVRLKKQFYLKEEDLRPKLFKKTRIRSR